jgi:hypothetical protein
MGAICSSETSGYLRIIYRFFLNLVCDAIGTAATPGLLYQPRVIVKMIVEKQMECRLAGKTEVLGQNLPQRHFCPSQFTYRYNPEGFPLNSLRTIS